MTTGLGYRLNNMKAYELFSDDQLLYAFQAKGDVKTFEEIYKRYWLRLYGWAYKQTSSRQEAEEMVQIVFEKLLKHRRGTPINNAGAYLAVLLRNVFYDFQRRKAQQEKFRQSHMDAPIGNPTED